MPEKETPENINAGTWKEAYEEMKADRNKWMVLALEAGACPEIKIEDPVTTDKEMFIDEKRTEFPDATDTRDPNYYG